MAEIQALYGPTSANWYGMREAEAGINAVRGYKWAIGQTLDIPLNDKGERSYISSLSAAESRTREASACFRNAQVFMLEMYATFDLLRPYPILQEDVTKILSNGDNLMRVYPNASEVVEQLRAGINTLRSEKLSNVTEYVGVLSARASSVIQTIEQERPVHMTIDRLAQQVYEKIQSF